MMVLGVSRLSVQEGTYGSYSYIFLQLIGNDSNNRVEIGFPYGGTNTVIWRKMLNGTWSDYINL